MNNTEVKLCFLDGEFECPKCGRRFPTHYKAKRGFFERRQLGRCYVCSLPNVERHIKACKGELV